MQEWYELRFQDKADAGRGCWVGLVEVRREQGESRRNGARSKRRSKRRWKCTCCVETAVPCLPVGLKRLESRVGFSANRSRGEMREDVLHRRDWPDDDLFEVN
jgi:hypothetical protein